MSLLTKKIHICRHSHVVYRILNMERLIGNVFYVNSHLIPVRTGILTGMVRILNRMVQHFQMGIIICYANKDLFKFDCLRCLKVLKMWQKICSGQWGHFPSNQQSVFLMSIVTKIFSSERICGMLGSGFPGDSSPQVSVWEPKSPSTKKVILGSCLLLIIWKGIREKWNIAVLSHTRWALFSSIIRATFLQLWI